MLIKRVRNFFFSKQYLIVSLIIFTPIITALCLLLSGVLFHVQLFTWVLFLICYCLTAFGITVGFHRYLTHRSFKAGLILKTILVGLGCMTYEGPPSFWVGVHRKHHISPDSNSDPHSPYKNEQTSLKAFWHSHMGWMLHIRATEWMPYAKELKESKIISFFNTYYLPVALSGLFLPALINGLYFKSWQQFWIGFLVCGVFRVFVQHQVTWSINSICHIWGQRHFKTDDNSRNNVLLGFLALGEGWHNGHHAFPGSAKHGLLWWQLDISYLFIKLLSLLGLAKNVKVVDKKAMLEKRMSQDDSSL